MTLEEKIEHIRTASMEEARAQGSRIIEERRKALEQIFNEHKETAARQSELALKAEINKAKQELNTAMAKAQIDLRHKQSKRHTELKNKLFKEVLELTNAYMKTDAYDELLVKYIENAVAFAPNSNMTIYIDPADIEKKEALEKRTGAVLTVSSVEFIGGIRAVLHDRRILIDNSFSSALLEEYDKFLFLGGGLNG